MVTTERIEGRRRAWYICGLVFSIVAAVVFGLASLAGIAGATGSASERARSGETFAGDVVLAIVAAIIGGLCIAFAVHMEHRLRRHQPAAKAWAGSAPTSFWPVRVRTGGGRRYSPGVTIFSIVLFTGIFAGLVVGAVVTHGEADRSARVQHHGIPRLAVVVAAQNHYHSTKGGGYYTADIRVIFSPPVQGQSTTVVRFPGRSNARPGEFQQILIDPRNTGYAELPGSPSTEGSSWIVLVVLAVLTGLLTAIVIRASVQMWRHHRNMTPEMRVPTDSPVRNVPG